MFNGKMQTDVVIRGFSVKSNGCELLTCVFFNEGIFSDVWCLTPEFMAVYTE